MSRHVQNLLLLFAAATLMPVGWLAILWGCARSLYWLPDSGEITDALLIWLTATWALVGLVLEPPRRSRRSLVRMVRAAVSRGRGRSSTSGLATVPVSRWPGAVAPLARPSAASPAGGRAGHRPSPSPSPTWRSA